MFPSNFVEEIAESEDGKTKLLESFLENLNNQINVNGRGEEQHRHHECLQFLILSFMLVDESVVAVYLVSKCDGTVNFLLGINSFF